MNLQPESRHKSQLQSRQICSSYTFKQLPRELFQHTTRNIKYCIDPPSTYSSWPHSWTTSHHIPLHQSHIYHTCNMHNLILPLILMATTFMGRFPLTKTATGLLLAFTATSPVVSTPINTLSHEISQSINARDISAGGAPPLDFSSLAAFNGESFSALVA